MISAAMRRTIKSSILHVNDRSSTSMIKAVVFGSSSQIARAAIGLLTNIHAQVLIPCRTSSKWVDYLRIGNFKFISFRQQLDLKDPDILDQVLENANVVINTIGGYHYIRDYDTLYESNVTVPRRIAEACARNPDILRLIHFSAVGIDPASTSPRLQTKWHGEQEVKAAYPNVTILRPTTIFGEYDNYVTRMGLIQQMIDYLPVIDDAKELRQPIYYKDIGQCVINCLRMPETIGKTYELGGPNVYSNREIMEIVYNKIGKPPNVRSIPYRKAHKFIQYMPHTFGFSRHMSLNDVEESQMDIVVSKDALKIEDLKVKPVSFPQNLMRILQDYQAKVDLTMDEALHGWYGGHDRTYEP
ncbi:unnamed protein product [Blepharisma stoltei]|uniref:RmlD-like substrate binding domain-containing protein n=1 Tax=Blepharisma stoltei TaxID=1481888 RepID=A0AAU9JS92_9CILI|nr:unnamed protein product [Blepharisma stoltei]